MSAIHISTQYGSIVTTCTPRRTELREAALPQAERPRRQAVAPRVVGLTAAFALPRRDVRGPLRSNSRRQFRPRRSHPALRHARTPRSLRARHSSRFRRSG
jgi:hypothetical protein